jgi:hypothetical protein
VGYREVVLIGQLLITHDVHAGLSVELVRVVLDVTTPGGVSQSTPGGWGGDV